MEKTKGFLAEFRAFATRGNVMDMAVGVIIGAAFKAIIDSLVADVIMPFIGIFANTSSFEGVMFQVGGADILVGKFISAVLNFLIVALVIFCMVKAINGVHAKLESYKKTEEAEAEAEEEEEPAPTTEELLAQILAELQKEK